MWRTLLYDMTTEEDITSVNKEKQTKKTYSDISICHTRRSSHDMEVHIHIDRRPRRRGVAHRRHCFLLGLKDL